MSHFTTIKTEIYDPDILRQTLSELSLEFEELGRTPAGSNPNILVHVTGMPSIEFRRNTKTGAYEIRGEHESLRRERVKKVLEKVRQEYACRKVIRAARARGFTLTQEERFVTGTIKLTLRRVA